MVVVLLVDEELLFGVVLVVANEDVLVDEVLVDEELLFGVVLVVVNDEVLVDAELLLSVVPVAADELLF